MLVVHVADQMRFFAFGRFAVDLAQEIQALGMAVTLGAARNHERAHDGRMYRSTIASSFSTDFGLCDILKVYACRRKMRFATV